MIRVKSYVVRCFVYSCFFRRPCQRTDVRCTLDAFNALHLSPFCGCVQRQHFGQGTTVLSGRYCLRVFVPSAKTKSYLTLGSYFELPVPVITRVSSFRVVKDNFSRLWIRSYTSVDLLFRTLVCHPRILVSTLLTLAITLSRQILFFRNAPPASLCDSHEFRFTSGWTARGC